MSVPERELLWTRLRDAALVEGDAPASGEGRSPWFVRVMLGFAGWIGALFLLGFVGAGFALIIKSPAAAWALGVLACIAAAVIFRASRSDFASQFGLAVSLSGQALMAFGLFDWLGAERTGSGLALALAAQQALLFVVIPSFVHRVWSAWSAAFGLQVALANAGFSLLVPAFTCAAFLAAWLYEFDFPRRGELLRAAGYGLALAAVQSVILHAALRGSPGLFWIHGARESVSAAASWGGAAASGAILLWAVAAILRRAQVRLGSGPGGIALIGAAILAAASIKAPGIAPAVTILVVGYANGNRVLAGLGIVAGLCYLSYYYYALQMTLLEKSALLAATGVALLVARLAMKRWWPPSGEGAAELTDA